MATMFTIDNLTADQAEYLRATIAPASGSFIDRGGIPGALVRFGCPADGVRVLESLPEDSDGHVDDQQQCWIGGTVAGTVEKHENW